MPRSRPDTTLFELHAEVCKSFSHPKRLQIIETLRDNTASKVRQWVVPCS